MKLQENQPLTTDWAAPGQLVAFPAEDRKKIRMLDAFYRPTTRRGAPLLVFVRDGQQLLPLAIEERQHRCRAGTGWGILSFNNRGRNAAPG